ncbi:MAG: tetratricopeptide repeat protein [Verrucomicrobiia bacterium]
MKKRQSPPGKKAQPGPRFASGLFQLLSRPFWVCVLLAVATVVVYWPAVGFDYVNYDDTEFVATNPHVLGGLTWENVRWAFGTGLDANWVPLTWLSYMLDVEWSGSTAAGLHLTNILLHAANTVLVFLLFRRLTGAHWRSAVLAGLFGWHPLHVESVAWVAERKDVLSTCFGLLSLIAYTGYATGERSPATQTESIWSRVTCHVPRFYWLALLFFAFSLMCKPMLVTLPCVLWLLDYWPLRRIEPEKMFIHRAPLSLLIWEKIPFFMLAAIAAALTVVIQHQDRAMESLASRPFGMRMANALVAYASYLGKTFWPVDLTNPYLLTRHLPWGQVLAAGALLLGLSVWAVLAARKRPYGLVGWLWFLGTMLPVIGLVQVGVQSMADRYTYLPLLGIFWIGVWAAAELAGRWRLPGGVVALATLVVLGTCAARTRVQLDYWRNGESLFRHAIATTQNNFVAFEGLGCSLYSQGRLDEAMFYYLKALELRPSNENALTNLNDALVQIDAFSAATHNPRAQVRQTGADYANAHNTLGLGLAMNDKLEDAIRHFRKALLYDPDHVNARINLGYALTLQGRLDEAIGQCAQVLRQSPHQPRANNILGFALLKQGRWAQAVAPLREALQSEPENAEAQFNLGQALAALGQREEALVHFKEALRLDPGHPNVREQLNQLEGAPH